MRPIFTKHINLIKTTTYLLVHLVIGFSVAYIFTGSVAVAGGIALVEPLANAIAFFFHEKIWNNAIRTRASAAVSAD